MRDYAECVSPEALYDAVWSTAYDNFFDGPRLKGWDRWRNHGHFRNYDEAYRAINEMLSSLNDRYTWFKLPERLEQDEVEAENPQSPVRVQWLRGGIALVHLSSFSQRNTADAMFDALRSVEDARGFILDLRGNGGGILGQANTMLSLFMDRGEALLMKYFDKGKYTEEAYWLGPRCFEMTLRDRDGNVTGTNNNVPRLPNVIGGRPLHVLIDSKTASASEFFAATLRDHKLARLYGTATGGKGISQSTVKLPGGHGLQLTNGTFLPPSRQFFGDHKQTVYNGLEPHYRVSDTGRGDHVLDVAYNHMLRDLEPRRQSSGGGLLLAGAIGLGLAAFAGTMGGGRRVRAA